MNSLSKLEPTPSFQVAYETRLGKALHASLEEALKRVPLNRQKGKINLIFTSPPFPLRTKKSYGNLTGDNYLDWLTKLAPRLVSLLSDDGSIVIEMGNSWEPGRPVMSTLPLEVLLAFRKSAGLELCQQFICHNPARLPGPAQWVNIERIRVKDSFTHVWWMARTATPKANNRNVLIDYSRDMKTLIEKKKYNEGTRPSGHVMRNLTFAKDNGGAIPSNVLSFANTAADRQYMDRCRQNGLKPHPARMHPGVAEFFIKLLTDKGDLVFDPFAGSNTTGTVAESLRRRWLAVEPNREFLDASLGRFDRDSIIRVG